LNARRWQPLLPALSMLLAACAGTPSQSQRAAVIKKPAVVVSRMTPQPVVAPLISAPSVSDFWPQMRGSFAMSDCDADPTVLAWARRYTKNPDRFEDQLRQAMPQLIYVQDVAVRYGVAGEFALLPWIESGFQSLPGRRNRPAGMWQIMPLTADKMGLRVDGRFDARLDVDASANAVMTLLSRYHDKFGDWRLVDYAYNTGEFNVAKLVDRFGTPPAEPAIPHLPVKSGAKEHLARLLGMACIVRDPERFGVKLPTISDEQHLVQVGISQSMPMSKAADQAGLPISTLQGLNAAFRDGTMDAGATSYVLLPADHAQKFRDSLLQTPTMTNDPGPSGEPPASDTDTAPSAKSADTATRGKTHTVKSGESLWQIAHRYGVSSKQLQQWNHLQGIALKPGLVLKIGGEN
jgi:membrane-bound lytic murein transglycosylase D